MLEWLKRNRDKIIRTTFLIPILLVVIMSISHVVSWYDIGNPITWAIYLSVAIEIFALASVAAASIDINRGTIWFLFGLVTLIQIIGNVFFEFNDIDITSNIFLSWVELVQPAFVDWDLTDHRRFLALIQGGTLPLMSLTALHFFIKFNDKDRDKTNVVEPDTTPNKPINNIPDIIKPDDNPEDDGGINVPDLHIGKPTENIEPVVEKMKAALREYGVEELEEVDDKKKVELKQEEPSKEGKKESATVRKLPATTVVKEDIEDKPKPPTVVDRGFSTKIPTPKDKNTIERIDPNG
jgi:hypothetical protein